MRKSFLVILAVMLIVGVAVSPSQALISNSPDARVKTLVVAGTSGVQTAITTNNRILGWKITGSSAAIAGLYDASTLGTATATTIFDEDGCIAGGSASTWYPAPRNISTGLTVVVNASTTIVTIYYE